MRTARRATAALVAAALFAVPAPSQERKLTYPDTKKVEVTDTYHGTAVSDPFRWLEDDVR